MLQIWTAQMAIARQAHKLAEHGLVQADCLDITVKSAQGLGKFFAPTWEMVMGVKNGTMSEALYRSLYNQTLDMRIVNDASPWKFLLSKDKIVFLCYCRYDQFCHRFELKDRAVATGAEYMGEIR